MNLNEILDYQIETIIRNGTTYEFEIINSPSITVDGKDFLARTNMVYRIREHHIELALQNIPESAR